MPQPRGKRSLNGQIKQKARKFIWETSFNDTQKAETVCLVDSSDVLNYVTRTSSVTDEGVQLSQVPDVRRGLVLTDSRGEGWYQT